MNNNGFLFPCHDTCQFTKEVETVRLFESLANQSTTKVSYHETSTKQISSQWKDVNTIFPNFQKGNL